MQMQPDVRCAICGGPPVAPYRGRKYCSDKHRHAASRAAWEHKHPGRNAAWKRSNPDKQRVYVRMAMQRRRARVVGGSVTRDDWNQIIDYFGCRCAYCLGEYDKLEMDHIVAIARHGKNEPDNIVPACRSCNARKGARGILAMVR